MLIKCVRSFNQAVFLSWLVLAEKSDWTLLSSMGLDTNAKRLDSHLQRPSACLCVRRMKDPSLTVKAFAYDVELYFKPLPKKQKLILRISVKRAFRHRVHLIYFTKLWTWGTLIFHQAGWRYSKCLLEHLPWAGRHRRRALSDTRWPAMRCLWDSLINVADVQM